MLYWHLYYYSSSYVLTRSSRIYVCVCVCFDFVFSSFVYYTKKRKKKKERKKQVAREWFFAVNCTCFPNYKQISLKPREWNGYDTEKSRVSFFPLVRDRWKNVTYIERRHLWKHPINHGIHIPIEKYVYIREHACGCWCNLFVTICARVICTIAQPMHTAGH